MQRAAASSPSASPSTPSEPPSKRQRLSTGASQTTSTAEAQLVRDALAAEELKRSQAIARAAADAGESKWVLSYHEDQPAAVQTPLRIVSAGYSTIDSAKSASQSAGDDEDREAARPSLPGRRSFGKFNKTIERQQNPDLSSSSSESDKDSDEDSDADEDEEDDDDDDDPTGSKTMIHQMRKDAADRIRSERKAKRKADKAESARLAAERRTKEVNLNRSGGISNGGRSSSNASAMECFQCGERGHRKQDCPKLKARSQRRGPP